LRELGIGAVIDAIPNRSSRRASSYKRTGSRHVKRYPDVEELLQAGVSVYTTVNIQHIESQSDAVGKIIGIRVSEISPDISFSDADEIRLIDVTPEELNICPKAGKVYVKDMD
jgi:two-component system sensor histidine kinase KdpD